MDSTGDDYILDQVKLQGYVPDAGYSESVYVPYYHPDTLSPFGLECKVYKYGRYVFNAMHPIQIWPFLSETIGLTFLREPDSQYPATREKVTVRNKILRGQDSILILEGIYYYGTSTMDKVFPLKRYQEWVKNVGL